MNTNHSRAFSVKHWWFTASHKFLHCWDILVIPFKVCPAKCTGIHELPPQRSQSCNCIFKNKFFLWSRAIVFLQEFQWTEKDSTSSRARPFTCSKFPQEQGLNWQQRDTHHTNGARLFWSGLSGGFPANSLPQNLLGILSWKDCFLFPR